ncbi:MAG TPA: nucleotidyl transferase AbiEii/AbiGii toxin family protein [Verrucomicrobiota bacterium]|nr:nucleotidyl transferase AbiEii/AbiGii toxin family protein [Verrucomicrobiota bacterium]
MLPPETLRLWDFFHGESLLRGFVLIGGTALALHLRHRISEDLDFIHPGPRLPREPLLAAVRNGIQQGWKFEANDNPLAVDEFTLAGEDIHDFQQDFRVNGATRVTFFAPEQEILRVVATDPQAPMRVASVDELFKTKCLVTARRSKTRDWLDLYLLLRDHGYSLLDYRAAFLAAGIGSQYESGLQRMCHGIPQRNDEGYEHLLPSPPSLEQMRKFFQQQRDWLEQTLAQQASP